jgi:hypothetical protein
MEIDHQQGSVEIYRIGTTEEDKSSSYTLTSGSGLPLVCQEPLTISSTP